MSDATNAGDSPFALRTVLTIILIGACAIAGAAFLALYGDTFSEPLTVQPSSYSRSVIGHKALVETLRRLGIPVLASRFESASKAGDGGLLVVAEPDDASSNTTLLAKLATLPHALLILPKRQAIPAARKPTWAEGTSLVSAEHVTAVFAAALGQAKLVRHEGKIAFGAGRFAGEIKLADAQFITSEDLTPIVSGPDGILLGEYAKGGHTLWVLSDPDLVSNRGIVEADNAEIAIAIVNALRPSGGPVVVDETVHGFEERSNLLHRIFQLPFVIVTISTAAAALLLVWAGSLGFGTPQPPEAAVAAGKGTLIRNAADLLCLGRSVGMVLSGYLRATIGEAQRELRGPNGLLEAEQASWLDRQAARRGLSPRLVGLREETLRLSEAGNPDARRALHLAIDIHRWKEEMLNGAGRSSRPR